MKPLGESAQNRRLIGSTVCACLIFSVIHTQIAFAASSANASFENTKEHLVVVDPGHGMPDPGAVQGKLYEKDINLKVSTDLAELLAKRGFQVCMTRAGDHDFADSEDEKRRRRHRMDLVHRHAVIQNADGDAVISVHCNWSRNASSEGAIVLFQPGNDEAGRLAEHIYKSLHQANIKASSLPSVRSVYLLKHTEEPCVLVELGFLSNKREAQRLTDPVYQKQLASAIEAGVSSYLRPYPSNPAPSATPKHRMYVHRIVKWVQSVMGSSEPVKHGGVHVCSRPDNSKDRTVSPEPSEYGNP